VNDIEASIYESSFFFNFPIADTQQLCSGALYTDYAQLMNINEPYAQVLTPLDRYIMLPT